MWRESNPRRVNCGYQDSQTGLTTLCTQEITSNNESGIHYLIGTWSGNHVLQSRIIALGLPWWRSGWESACRCRGHGFEPWSGKIPHAADQLGPWATTTEPVRLEPVLRNKRGRDSERPAHRDEEWPPLAATRESPLKRNEDPTQPKINKLIN